MSESNLFPPPSETSIEAKADLCVETPASMQRQARAGAVSPSPCAALRLDFGRSATHNAVSVLRGGTAMPEAGTRSACSVQPE